MVFSAEDISGSFLKEILHVECLGDFGYHGYYVGKWTVCHLASGLALHKFESERDARAYIKELYLGVKTRWKPEISCVINYMDMKKEAQDILQNILGIEPEQGDDFYDTESDIPL